MVRLQPSPWLRMGESQPVGSGVVRFRSISLIFVACWCNESGSVNARYKKRLARGEIPLQGFEKELQSHLAR